MNNDIYIYKPIAPRTEENYCEAICALDIISQLEWIEGNDVNVHVNCPGGSVTESMAVFNALNACQKNVVMKVEGMAASMASVIIMAGNEIVMSPFARIMTHRIKGQSTGNADQMRTDADQIEQFENTLCEIYSRRTGLTAEDCKAKFMTESDTWFTAEEAIALKLADRIEEGTLKMNMIPMVSDPMALYNSLAAILTVPNQSKDMDFLKLKNQLQLDANVTEDAFLAQVGEWRDKAGQVDTMTAELQGFKNAAALAETNRINGLIEKAVNEKRILPTQKEMWTSLFAANAAQAEAALMGIAPAKDLTNLEGGNKTERDQFSAMTWDQLDRGMKLETCRAQYYDLYEAKFEEKFGKKPGK